MSPKLSYQNLIDQPKIAFLGLPLKGKENNVVTFEVSSVLTTVNTEMGPLKRDIIPFF